MPPPLAYVRLETPHLVIRELERADAPAVQAWTADDEVVRLLPWGPTTMGETETFLEAACEARWRTPRLDFQLGFELRDSRMLVGAGGVWVRSAQEGTGELGYTLRRDVWGHGLATEAARALVRFGLGVLRLHRLSATCHVENAASARVLEKAGLAREGRLRQSLRARGAWCDAYLYAVVEGDPLPAEERREQPPLPFT